MIKSHRQNCKTDRKKEIKVPIDRKEKITHEENVQKEDIKMSANQNISFVAVETIKCELDRKTTEQEIQERAESIKNGFFDGLCRKQVSNDIFLRYVSAN